MELQTVTHVQTHYKHPLHLETTTRALRQTVWVALFLAQELRLTRLQHTLVSELVDIDQLLETFESS